MGDKADFVIVAVKYDDNNEYITHVRCYKREGELLVDLRECSREGIANMIDQGNIWVTATKNPISGLWEKGALVKRCGQYIHTLSEIATRDYLGTLPKY